MIRKHPVRFYGTFLKAALSAIAFMAQISIPSYATEAPTDLSATSASQKAIIKPVTVSSTIKPIKTPTTVSKPIPPTEPSLAPVLIALNPRFDDPSANKQLRQTVVVPAPPLLAPQSNSLMKPEEPQFVPVLKLTQNPADTQNRGNFFDQHEFGIQLRSPF